MKTPVTVCLLGFMAIGGWLSGKWLAQFRTQKIPAADPGPQRFIAASSHPGEVPASGFSDEWRKAVSDPDKTPRMAALKSLSKDWAAKDAPAAFAAVLNAAQTSGDEGIELLMAFILDQSRIPEPVPAQSAAWMDSLPPDLIPPDKLSRLERAVAGAWLPQNPRKAADWLLSRSTPETRAANLESLVDDWALISPNACGEWLRELPPGADTDRAVEIFARNIVNEDPESAFAWASRISESSRRERMQSDIMEKWRILDPAAAAAPPTRLSEQ